MNPSSNKWRKRQQIAYTARDLRLLYALLGSKYMTTTQICALFWLEASSNPLLALKSCQRRLRQLERSGVIRRIHQAAKRGEGSKPDLFKLSANSVPLLVYECGVDPGSVDVTVWADEELNPKIKHGLAITDVHIQILKACQTGAYRLEEWLDEGVLRGSPSPDAITITKPDGTESQITIFPDARFTLGFNDKRGIYRLEVDRATIDLEPSNEQKRSIAQKIERYLLLEKSASYHAQYGSRPLRVLWAVQGERRLRNMLKVTDRVIQQFVTLPAAAPTDAPARATYEQKVAEGKRLNERFLFTTLAQIQQHNPLTAPIWQVVGHTELQSLL